jgi:hypothetical protein
MNKEEHYRETIAYLQYSGVQRLGEAADLAPTPRLGVLIWLVHGARMRVARPLTRPSSPGGQRSAGRVPRWSSLSTASYCKSWKINTYQ